MATVLIRSVLFVIFAIYVFGDEIEMEVQSGTVMKMLRDMVNQTAAESLNLPANATSIRENITDTFSCENRTYGYYADVDNECQIFHVCLTSQTATGRNVTYRWSFICPEETVFNQETLVCTRERDSIPCEDSPNYYDLNMEIGKIADPDIIKEEGDVVEKKEIEIIPEKKNVNRQTNRKKQNIIMEALMKDAVEQMGPIDVTEEERFEMPAVEPVEIEEQPSEYKPQMNGANDKYDENERLGSERSMKRTGKKMSRGSRRFRIDV